MSAERKFTSVPDLAADEVYVVRVDYDPTHPRGMRWSAKVTRQGDRYGVVTIESCCMTRRSAEQKALRHIRRMPGARSYTFTVTRQEVSA